MNNKERDIVAYLICLADEAGVPVKSAIDELSRSDPKFRPVYDNHVKDFEDDAELFEELKRRLHDEFGPGWALQKDVKKIKSRSADIWAEITASA